MDTRQTDHPYRCIGAGCCGSIWAPNNDPDWVIKREDGGDHGRSVANDQVMHHKVIAAIPESGLPARIPASYDIIEANDSWWNANLHRFPNGTTACKAYMQEAAIRASQENKDCLIRVYTGKRRLSDRLGPFFNLRNYGLHIDQMDESGLDTSAIVRVLATALAHCYWRGHVDANDVEFVLAPATPPAQVSTPTFRIGGIAQELAVWMLDYDCVREMPQSIEGIQQAVTVFYRNDSYFPRPHFSGHTEADVRMWETFKAFFLAGSKEILNDLTLAEEWVRLTEDESRRRASIGTPCWCAGNA
jgi:hypothetical protein